jgi:hypothetical protein
MTDFLMHYSQETEVILIELCLLMEGSNAREHNTFKDYEKVYAEERSMTEAEMQAEAML